MNERKMYGKWKTSSVIRLLLRFTTYVLNAQCLLDYLLFCLLVRFIVFFVFFASHCELRWFLLLFRYSLSFESLARNRCWKLIGCITFKKYSNFIYLGTHHPNRIRYTFQWHNLNSNWPSESEILFVFDFAFDTRSAENLAHHIQTKSFPLLLSSKSFFLLLFLIFLLLMSPLLFLISNSELVMAIDKRQRVQIRKTKSTEMLTVWTINFVLLWIYFYTFYHVFRLTFNRISIDFHAVIHFSVIPKILQGKPW